jgi:hypothetical protein
VKNCSICQTYKQKKRTGKISLHNLASSVGELASMDGFNLITMDKKRDKEVSTQYIQVIDHFSRYRTIRKVTGFTSMEGMRVLSEHM